MLQIIGTRSETLRTDNSRESEIRRRRFWACYLMHCQNTERLSHFQLADDMLNLPLPWPEVDFDAGVSNCAPVTLKSVRGNGGIFSELTKVLTLW